MQSPPTQNSSPTLPMHSDGHLQNAHQVACIECQQMFSPMEVLNYGEWTVCSGCKDRFIQKLEQGGVINGITAWRHKRLVRVMKDNPKLPMGCAKCGELATVEREKTMRHLSMRSLLGAPALFIGLIPGLVLMTLLGSSIKLKFGHCEKHAQRIKISKWIAGVTLISGILLIATFVVMPTAAPQWAWIPCIILFVTGLIASAIASPGVSVVRGNKEHADFRVQSRKLKKALPEWNDFLS